MSHFSPVHGASDITYRLIDSIKNLMFSKKIVCWSEDFSIGICELDDQHKDIIDLLNVLYDQVEQKEERATILATIEALAWKIKTHFAIEEALMRMMELPQEEYEDHFKEHQVMVEQLDYHLNKIRNGSPVTVALIHFCSIWFIRHIQEDDRKMAPDLVSRGIKTSNKSTSFFGKLFN